MLIATFDDDLGLIVSVATGFQTEQEIQRHLAAVDVLAKTAKARTGRILHLVDATEAAVQPSSGSRSIKQEAMKGRIKVDRCAVVMASTLCKMQTLRLYKDLPLQVFENRRDAIDWLQSYQTNAQAALLPKQKQEPRALPVRIER